MASREQGADQLVGLAAWDDEVDVRAVTARGATKSRATAARLEASGARHARWRHEVQGNENVLVVELNDGNGRELTVLLRSRPCEVEWLSRSVRRVLAFNGAGFER